jgi:hypothetical protein
MYCCLYVLFFNVSYVSTRFMFLDKPFPVAVSCLWRHLPHTSDPGATHPAERSQADMSASVSVLPAL